MSTPISKAALLCAGLAIMGCDAGLNVTRSAPEGIKLLDGMVVSGTYGWCVDTNTTRTDGATSVVVLGSCAAIAGNALAPRPSVPGVVTVSVENNAGTPLPADLLADFIASPPGRAALALDGNADSVRILDSRKADGALFIHVDDRSTRAPNGPANDYWRALFDMNGRFITVSLIGLSERPIPPSRGFSTLKAQIDQLKSANPG